MLVSFLIAAQLNKPISVTIEPTLLCDAVKLLGLRLGRDLSVGKPLEDLVITVRVQNASPEDLLASIATTCRAKWTPSAAGLKLDRSAQESLADERDAVRYRTDEIVQALSASGSRDFDKEITPASAHAKLDDYINRNGQQWNPNTKAAWKLLGESPPDRLFSRILAQLPPEDLAAASIKYPRVVWSTNPTASQLSLPATEIGAMIDRALREQIAWSGEIRRLQLPSQAGGSQSEGRRNLEDQLWDTEPSTLTLVMDSKGHYLTVRLNAYSSSGRLIFSRDRLLSGPLGNQPLPDLVELKAPNLPITMTPISQNYWKALRSNQRLAGQFKSLKAVLSDPVHFPPERYWPGQALVARFPERNIVAVFPSFLSCFVEDVTAASGFWNHVQYSSANQILSIRPRSFFEENLSECGRRVLKAVTALSQRSDANTLNCQSEIAAALPTNRRSDRVAQMYLALFDATSDVLHRDVWLNRTWTLPALRVYGQLPDEIKVMGGSAQLRDLSEGARTEIERAAFYSQPDWLVPRQVSSPTGPLNVGLSDLEKEITFACPNGIPLDATLTVSVETQPMIRLKGSAQKDTEELLTAFDLGQNKYLQSVGIKGMKGRNSPYNPGKCEVVAARSVQMEVLLTAKAKLAFSTLHEASGTPTEYPSIADLPTQLIDDLNRGFAAAKRLHENR